MIPDEDPPLFQDQPREAEPEAPVQPVTSPAALDPELRRLLSEPDILAAIERGDKVALERTLRRRRRYEFDPLVCQKLDELLRNRRLFVQPITAAPTMMTFNGVGTMIYGRRDFDPSDSTYIATLWFTVLFLPLVPLRQYLVRDTGADGYQFVGKVSMSQGLRRLRRAELALLVAAVAGITATFWRAGKQADVYFVNGLDEAVAIELGDQVIPVPPDSQTTRRLAAGRYTVRVTDSRGAVLEDQTIDVLGGQDLVAYNVLGAAPLIVEEVVYSGQLANVAPQGDSAFDHCIGHRLVQRSKVQYVFEEPPAEIRLANETAIERRKHAFLLPGGWRTSLNLLNNLGDLNGAATLMETIALADPADVTAVRLACALVNSARGPEQSLGLIERLVELTPDAVDVHRLRQEAMSRAGQRDKAREIYRQMSADQPDSPMAGYLRTRIEPVVEAVDLYRDLVARFPDYYYAVNGYAYLLAMARRFEDALPLFERARQIQPEHTIFPWDLYLMSLVAAGRTDEALATLVDECQRKPESVSLGTAVLYGRLAQLQPGTALPHPVDHYLGTLDAEPEELDLQRAWFELLVYGEVEAELLSRLDNEDARQAIEISSAVMRGPDLALTLAQAATPENLARIEDVTLVLLACEAGRLGQRTLARKLLDGVSPSEQEQEDALERFVLDGGESEELAELELAVQAALHYARARRAEAAAQPAAQHFANARADDVLRTAVARACDNWPSAKAAVGTPPVD